MRVPISRTLFALCGNKLHLRKYTTDLGKLTQLGISNFIDSLRVGRWNGNVKTECQTYIIQKLKTQTGRGKIGPNDKISKNNGIKSCVENWFRTTFDILILFSQIYEIFMTSLDVGTQI